MDVVRYREVMQNMPFFRGLSDEVSFRLCMALKPVMMLKNDVVFMQGNPVRPPPLASCMGHAELLVLGRF